MNVKKLKVYVIQMLIAFQEKCVSIRDVKMMLNAGLMTIVTWVIFAKEINVLLVVAVMKIVHLMKDAIIPSVREYVHYLELVDPMLGVKQLVTDLIVLAYQDILEIHKLNVVQLGQNVEEIQIAIQVKYALVENVQLYLDAHLTMTVILARFVKILNVCMVAAAIVIVVLHKNVMKTNARTHANLESVESMLSAKPSTMLPYADVHLITLVTLKFCAGKYKLNAM